MASSTIPSSITPMHSKEHIFMTDTYVDRSDLYEKAKGQKLHLTVGVYPNNEYKFNHVAANDLASHTAYNLSMRPGRAFFVDGEMIYKGSLNEEQIKYWTNFVKTLPAPDKVKYPYV